MTERELFLALLDLPDGAARTDYLDRVCSGNPAMRTRIESLLSSHGTADSFLGSPAVAPLDRHELVTREIDDATPDDDNETGDLLGFLRPSTRPDSLGRIGHYEILEVLGRGGFGIVFRAFDDTLQRVVAIKVLSAPIAATSPARKRFLREARSSAKVRHTNVVQVYAVEEQPLPYLVMEFIPGETLKERLDRTGPLETAEVLQIGRQIALGLAAAHSTGLIHRDIKPGNILIEAGPEPHVKITDFGLARAADDASTTQSGIVAGTPMFMAPEQVRGDALDHRADLFSLGSVLYTMCCGRPPFRANNTLAVLKRVAEDTPRPIPEIIPEVPQWLCDLITRLQAKNPADRFGRAQDVADLLAKGLQGLPADGLPPPLPLAASPPPAAAEPAAPRSRDPGETRALPLRVRPRFAGRRPWVVAASLLLAPLVGLGLAEASGVSDVRGVVIRLFTPDGTLVVEVDDPGVSVRIEGSDLVITGTGVKELRVKPGDYRVVASKDGRVVQQDLVRVERNGRRVIRVAREAAAVVDASLERPRAAAAPVSVPVDGLINGWGTVVDPDRDCRIHRDGETLVIDLPNKRHDLTPFSRLFNVPRVVRPIEGDFEVQVKVEGEFKPVGPSKRLLDEPSNGAGLIVLGEGESHVILDRMAFIRKGTFISAVELAQRGEGGNRGRRNPQLGHGTTYLRLARKGNRFEASASSDGKEWNSFDPLESHLPDRVKVGVAAINTSNEPFSVTFSEFKLEGK
jgi:serine/threonine protein kinase/regulation of enolase protein 1 (concanavalin A-like superfamily)